MEAVEEDMQRIAAASDKMSRLLSQVLQLSRIGRVTHPPEDIGLAELAHEAVELLSGMIADQPVDNVILER